MKDWKTTLTGLLTAIGYAVLDALQKGHVEPKTVLISAGIALLGALSGDAKRSEKK